MTAPNSFSEPLYIAIFEIAMEQYAYEDAWFPGTENKSTQKYVLEAGTPTIEKACLQGVNTK